MKKFLSTICFCFLSVSAEAAIYYVDHEKAAGGDGTNGNTACRTIQDAITNTIAGDTVIVTNGVYGLEDATVYPEDGGKTYVSIIKNITVKSVNGPLYTSICGPGTNNWGTEISARGLWISKGSFSGFSISNCLAYNSTQNTYSFGGGIYANGGVISNCIIRGNLAKSGGGIVSGNSAATTKGQVTIIDTVVENNYAYNNGGGLYDSDGNGNPFFMTRCSFSGNVTTNLGGGAYFAKSGNNYHTIIGCLFANNVAQKHGGGVYNAIGTVNPSFLNCTFVYNTASTGQAGGIYSTGGTIKNSIVYFNYAPTYSNFVESSSLFAYSCMAPSSAGTGNISIAPTWGTGYRLAQGSSCINAGTNSLIPFSYTKDLDGNYRIAQLTIDMGAYEYQGIPQTITFNALPDLPVSRSFYLSATASSGLKCTYTNFNNVVATIGNVSNITGQAIGSSVVTAYQSGDFNYAPAIPVSQTLSVIAPVPDTQIIFWASSNYNPTFGDTNIAISATATNSNISCFFASLDTNIVQIIGSTYSNVNAGIAQIIATNAGNFAWLPISSTQTITVAKLSTYRILNSYIRSYGDTNFPWIRTTGGTLDNTYYWSAQGTTNGFPRGRNEDDLSYIIPLPYPSLIQTPTNYHVETAEETFSNQNYDVTYLQQLSSSNIVTKRNISITANNREKVYGNAIALGTTAFALENLAIEYTPDRIASVILTASNTETSGDVGLFPIIPSNPTGTAFDPDNFNIVYHDGTLTVRPTIVSIDPEGGIFTGSQQITLSAAPSSSLVYYTTNGSIPSIGDTLYTVPFTITERMTVNAISYSNLVYSATYSSAVFLEQIKTPIISPDISEFSGSLSITVTCATVDCVILYSEDGSDPYIYGNLYTAPFSITSTKTIRAIAFHPGVINSDTASRTYTRTIPTAPTYDPLGGTSFSVSQQIQLNAEAGSRIYYTTDGSEPTLNSTLYTVPFTISSAKTVKSFAYADPNSSETNQATYSEIVADPIFSPSPSPFAEILKVEISCASQGVEIRYTTDDSDPTPLSALYGGAITITDTTTLKAKAFKTGATASAIVSGYYEKNIIHVPIYSPVSGNYFMPQSIFLSSGTEGADIYFTTNGSAPTLESIKYTSPIDISSTTIIKSFAYLSPYSSDTNQSSYVEQLYAPVLIPASTSFLPPFSVTMTNASPCSIYYTTNGDEPTLSSSLYSAPVSLTSDQTLKAKAFKDGAIDSSTTTEDYTFMPISAPVYAPTESTFSVSKIVSISCSTAGTTIYYTTNGTEPTLSSPVYTSPITIRSSTTVKAFAYLSPYSSITNQAIYTEILSAPVIAPPSATFAPSITITMTNYSSGDIQTWYTLDGTEPTNESPSVQYTIPLIVDSTTTVKAKSYRVGINPSITKAEIYNIAATIYVSVAGLDGNDGSSWNNAKKTLQGGVDAASAGYWVVVSNGTYNLNSFQTPGYSSVNRVYIDKDIVVKSLNGPSVTFILGSGTNLYQDANAIRGVFLKKGVLNGFTIKDGTTDDEGDSYYDRSGGGLNMYEASTSAYATNCIIINNRSLVGGGALFPRLLGCIISNNFAEVNGSGVYYGDVSGSIITRNRNSVAVYGANTFNSEISYNPAGGFGFASGSIVSNCLIRNNSSTEEGAGLSSFDFNNKAYDSIITGNQNLSPEGNGGGCSSLSLYNCVISNNVAYKGGGCYNSHLYGCTVLKNVAYYGGGMAEGEATNTTFFSNSATNGGGCYNVDLYNSVISNNYANLAGGGIYNDGAHTAVSTSFITNRTPFLGGGIYNNSTASVFTNCVISCNISASASVPPSQGGGVWDNGGKYIKCQIVKNSLFNGHDLTGGAGIYCNGIDITELDYCNISSNYIDYRIGSGLFAPNKRAEVYNCVFYKNTGKNGVYLDSYTGATVSGANLYSCSVVSNTLGSAGGIYGTNTACYNTVIYGNLGVSKYSNPLYNNYDNSGHQIYKMIPFNFCCSYPTPPGNSNTNLDPIFINDSAAISPLSPMRDLGENSYKKTPIDIAGNLRVYNYTIDIGAYELNIPFPSQTINFPSFPTQNYGTSPFNAGATASSGLPCSYSFVYGSDGTVAQIGIGGLVVVKKTGTCQIVANQAGNDYFFAAAPVTQNLTVAKGILQTFIPSLTKAYGDDNPILSFTYTGFATGDSEVNLDISPTLVYPAFTNEVSTYTTPYTLASDLNYDFSYHNGTITITQRVITVKANARTKIYGHEMILGNSEFTVSGTSPLVSDTFTSVDLSSSGTNTTSDLGTYTIASTNLTGTFLASNYSIHYIDGILRVSPSFFVNILRPDDTGDGTSWETAKKTIQGAVIVSADGDSILVTNGIYTGLSNAVIRVNDKSLYIKSVNGSLLTILQGSTNIGCLYENSSDNKVILTGFTLRNGDLSSSGGGAYRGDLRNCSIYNNSAMFGGGAAYSIIRNCQVFKNSSVQGGGLFTCQTFDSAISNNLASGNGGGIIYGTASNCLISANKISTYKSNVPDQNSEGAGVDQASVSDSYISKNTSENTPAKGAGASSSQLERCWIVENMADIVDTNSYGGGAYKSSLDNCVVYSNAACYGGGIYGSLQTALRNCTVYGNRAYYGGGISHVWMTNSIVGGNIDLGDLMGESSTPNYFETNVLSYCYQIYNSSDSQAPIDLPIYSNKIEVSSTPLFKDISSFKLVSGNYSIDNGDNVSVAGSLDIYGNSRIINSRVDMGAVEYSKVGSVIISPADGTYTNSMILTLSCPTEGSSIYYTTNESVPTTSSFLYSGPTQINADVISARGFKAGIDEGDVSVSHYSVFYRFYLNVYKGTGSGAYTNGSIVNIVAEAPIAKQIFFCWTGDVSTVSSVTATNATVTVNRDMNIFATYRGPYTLTVNNGSGSGTFSYGQYQDIIANTPADGYVFYHWTGDVSTVFGVGNTNTSILIFGNYTVAPQYLKTTNYLTVVGGTGSGYYPVFSNAIITAANSWTNDYRFYQWTGMVSLVASPITNQTTVQMLEDTTVFSQYVYAPFLLVNLLDGNYRFLLDREFTYSSFDVLYKTDYLLLKRIQQGTSVIGSDSSELGRDSINEDRRMYVQTNAFYMGIYEATQKQWENLVGDKPSFFTNILDYGTRPVEQISYDMLRGSSGFNWPSNSSVSQTSFMGLIRNKTGLMFDIPTESQWEYACRGGTTTALNNDRNLTNTRYDSTLSSIARYYLGGANNGYTRNSPASDAGTDKVGSLSPNSLGLYDMHGNAWEWCRDWYTYTRPIGTLTNYMGASNGVYRVLKGGSWGYYAKQCRSAYRSAAPSESVNFYDGMGFRIVYEVSTIDTVTHTLVVSNGIGSGDYLQNQPVTVVATIPENKSLNYWSSTPSGLGGAWNVYSATNIVSVPVGGAVLTPHFKDSIFYLNYYAYEGLINGNTFYSQSVYSSSNAGPITAVANTGFYFVSWSDGNTNSTRTDLNIISNMSYSAYFNPYPFSISVSTNLVLSEEGTTNSIFVSLLNPINTNLSVTVVKSGSSLVTNTVWSLNFTTNNYATPQEWKAAFVDATWENVNDASTYTFSSRGYSTNVVFLETDKDGVLSFLPYPDTMGYIGKYPVQQYYRLDDEVSLTAFVIQGYQFMGWSTNTEITGVMVNPTNIVYSQSTKDSTIFALFSPTNIVTSFYTNMAYFASQTNLYLSTFPALPVPNPPLGKSFGGWYTKTNGIGIKIQQGNIVSIATNFSAHAYFTIP